MVDQLGTEVVTVTVCLRRMEDKGFVLLYLYQYGVSTI